MHCSMKRTWGPQIIIVALDIHNSNTNVDSASERWVSQRLRARKH